jgi:hypothetical protein
MALHATASDVKQFFGAITAVFVVLAGIAGVVHFFFGDSALAAAIGFSIPLFVGLGSQLLNTK